jgi:hypothetical protein
MTQVVTFLTTNRCNRAIWTAHRDIRAQQMEFELTPANLRLLDNKVALLGGCTTAGADFVRKGLRPMKWSGSAKCADWAKLCEDGPGDYMFKETLPPDIVAPVNKLMELLRLLKGATCDVNDPQALAALASRKHQVTILVCEYERHFPKSEVCRVSHIVLHLCDMVQRWNNVRNFWCFLTERYARRVPCVTVITGFNQFRSCVAVLTGYNCPT